MMIIGLFVLINEKDNFLGVVLVGAGGFWFLSRYSDIPVKYYFFEYWPILLIIFGIALIFKRQNNKVHVFENEEINKMDSDYIDDVSILSSGRKTISSQNFKGGKTTVVLGGSVIDLHEANLAEGTNSLEVVAIFGGVEIILPRDWKVIENVTAIFGGVDDKRYVNPNQVYESNKVLVIRGTVLFGGCEIKTY
jgi:predicted membrane protein